MKRSVQPTSLGSIRPVSGRSLPVRAGYHSTISHVTSGQSRDPDVTPPHQRLTQVSDSFVCSLVLSTR